MLIGASNWRQAAGTFLQREGGVSMWSRDGANRGKKVAGFEDCGVFSYPQPRRSQPADFSGANREVAVWIAYTSCCPTL